MQLHGKEENAIPGL